ncbi:MBL fold metallo-hydrolase [Candidatus Nanosalina sp. VS9-1]|uniref:MBL fold metallo-hydrolase n=1 Tax=Candidatus Nanosalina sp. VS9-1 TaxID=3388566 RepID=UPI0039DF409E
MELQFLGTGGGRYVTGMQRRKTGGIVIKTDETQVHVDPGPGGLVNSHEFLEHPEETEAVLVTHAHMDHFNDAQAIIEMMVEAYNNAGVLLANRTVLEGFGDLEKAISDYHQGLCGRVDTMKEGSTHEVGDLEIECQEMFHSDPKTIGFTVESSEKKIGFWTDTEFSGELVDLYSDCDTLVVFCSRPVDSATSSHTAVDEVPDIVEASDADTVILTHFGYKLLDEGVEEQKKWLEEKIDAKVVMAEDGMKFPGNRTLDAF